MKEKIYTIPVTEAFSVDCECPMCVLEKKLDDEYVDYMLGPSLMEPDSRVETNASGFCKRHFELLYNKQVNRLGLGLIINSHMLEQNEKLKASYTAKTAALKKEAEQSMLKNLTNKISSKQTETTKFLDEIISELTKLENTCSVCSKLEHTMDRYIDVVLYLWSNEAEFKTLFNKKGFCLKHLRMLLEGAKKHLPGNKCAEFIQAIFELQLPNLERIQQEVDWFTKKFDYRFNDAPWGNSKDSIQRSIQKIVGYSDLK